MRFLKLWLTAFTITCLIAFSGVTSVYFIRCYLAWEWLVFPLRDFTYMDLRILSLLFAVFSFVMSFMFWTEERD